MIAQSSPKENKFLFFRSIAKPVTESERKKERNKERKKQRKKQS